MRSRRWASRGSLSPRPRIVGCQHSPQHLSPPTVRGRRQSPARWVPYVYVPRRALGNVPGAVPPHLPQHELMRSASPGFTLALPPPAAAFRSHPEGRSLAVLRRPAGAPALFAPSTWFLSLHTSWKCEGGCHRSRLCSLLPRRRPPPLPGVLQWSLVRTLGKQEHVLAC